MAQWKRIRLGTMRFRIQSLASLSGLRIRRCCELWCRSQTWLGSCIAVAPIRPLSWEPQYAVGVALKRPPPKKGKKALFQKEVKWKILTDFTQTVWFCHSLYPVIVSLQTSKWHRFRVLFHILPKNHLKRS